MDNLEKEQWRPAPGFEGYYEVSSSGRVRGLDRISKNKDGTDRRFIPARICKPSIMNTGYLRVSMSKTGFHGNKHVHILVALAFVPNPNGKPHVNHKDGNKANPVSDNLEWVTMSENIRHSVDVLKKGIGEIKGKLKADEVREIRALIKEGRRPVEIGLDYGVARATIEHIQYGRTWSHLA